MRNLQKSRMVQVRTACIKSSISSFTQFFVVIIRYPWTDTFQYATCENMIKKNIEYNINRLYMNIKTKNIPEMKKNQFIGRT